MDIVEMVDLKPEDLSFEEFVYLQLIKEEAYTRLEKFYSRITIESSLANKDYVKLLPNNNYELREKALVLFKSKSKIKFEDFWEKFHLITNHAKTNKEATITKWNRLKESEKSKAIANIEDYYNSLNDTKYCVIARTYLQDKRFNDEFKGKNTYNNVKML